MAHRESAARERAMRANIDAAEIRASTDRKVAALRAQVLAESETTERMPNAA